jgi:pyruvate/2-oxoglutarate dehydrogenase complex dihydrolipoamide dehydrogenase (E3) component
MAASRLGIVLPARGFSHLSYRPEFYTVGAAGKQGPMSKERKVEIAIIGAGTAGLSAYSEVHKVTENFVLIHGGPYGTTCARVGCMPSKILIQVANDFHRRHMLAREGILGGEALKIDPGKVLSYLRSLRDDFVARPQTR